MRKNDVGVPDERVSAALSEPAGSRPTKRGHDDRSPRGWRATATATVAVGLVVGGASLAPAVAATAARALKQSTVDFFDRYLKDDKSGLDRLRTHANVPGAPSLDEQPGTTGATTATTQPGS